MHTNSILQGMVKLYISRYILDQLVQLAQLDQLELTPMNNDNDNLIPDLTDVDEARKAFIANEIFNRKY